MTVPQISLSGGLSISRIIKGGWQLSEGHRQQPAQNPVGDMEAFLDAGVYTFDCADIYTGVEELIGKFISEQKKKGHAANIRVLTKFVPDYDALQTITKSYVEKVIDRSLLRLGVEALDMVQFSWWNYEVKRYVETAHWLEELRVQGKIKTISGTNFNTTTTREILESGIKLSSLQVQYSVLDNRPEKSLVDLCLKHQVKLLCYGTVAGGFLSERWQNQPEPIAPFENRSQIKYKLIIDAFGGWNRLQQLLALLKTIGEKYEASITNVATAYVLSRPAVASVIIGAGTARFLKENLHCTNFQLTAEEIESIAAFAHGPEGDVFDAERIKDGPHGKIMRYNLNNI
ncbi:MAG: aldo/keto reductase [Bacteroidetes bacterium]|nr:aldo/keto reductase [Bacteroidota bacterium]